MRIFVLGVGGTGSLLAQLLARQGHTVWCGDRDPERARKFLGKKSDIKVVETNARNLWSIVRAARGCNLIVNAPPAVFNEIILRAALRLRAHYLDLNSHLTRSLFKPEQLRFNKRFVAKNRAALICTGAAPGLTNLLANREKFRFPPPIGETTVYLAAQDEVCMVPYVIPIRDMDAKIGGNDFDRLYRWFRQGRLNRSQGIVRKRFPKTLTPRNVAALIRRGILYNARFAAAVLLRGMKDDQPLLVRWDASFPSLFQIRQRGLISTPISYATAHIAAVFIKHFPRDEAGVLEPEMLRAETRRAILAEVRSRDFRIKLKITKLKKIEEEF